MKKVVAVAAKVFTSDLRLCDINSPHCFWNIQSFKSVSMTTPLLESIVPDFIAFIYNNKPHTNQMNDQEQQQKGHKFLLPPVSLYSRSRTSNTLIKQIIGLAKHKKQQIEDDLKKKQPSNSNAEFNYVKSWEADEQKTIIKQYNNPALQEQMLARGSIDQWATEESPPKKSRLIHQEIRLASTEFESSPSRYRALKKEIKNDEHKEFPLPEKKYNRIRTEPRSKQSNSSLANLKDNTKYKNREPQRRSQKVQTLSVDFEQQRSPNLQQEEELKSLRDSKEEVQVNQFLQQPVFNESRYHSIEEQSIQKPITPSTHKKSEPTQVKPKVRSVKSKNSSSMFEPIVYPEPSQKMAQFYQAIYTLKKSTKTNERLERAAIALQKINTFFRKIQRVIGVCLLRVGKIVNKYPQTMLYQVDMPYSYFYIILSGKVKISGNNQMHKYCQTGETLLEQIIFDNPKNGDQPVSLEKAKTIEESWLLKIDLSELGKLERELVKYGFKLGLTQLKNLIKRNQIVKNWIRNKYKLLSNQ